MKIFELLDAELYAPQKRSYAPEYFRYLGYIKDYAASPAFFRANAAYSLFTNPEPVILKHELLAANTLCLYTDVDEFVLKYAEQVADYFSRRKFWTNGDHYAPDYGEICRIGLPGLLDKIDSSLKKYEDDEKKTETLRSMRHALCGFMEMIEGYAKKAEACKADESYDTSRLDFIIKNCKAIVNRKPETFAEALQLICFIHVAFRMESRSAMALSRLDQFLYPYYKADIAAGRTTDESVIELFENLFIKLRKDTVNICIGGQDENGNCQVNELSYCILKAVRNCNIPGPNLSLRYTQNTPDEFLDECLKVIGTGLGYPAIMNDDVNIAALKKYGYENRDACNYSMVGCIENFITGKQVPWTDGRFDVPRYFDYIFNSGVSHTNNSVGPDTGSIENIHTMDEFMDIFKKQLTFGAADYVARFNHFNNSINQECYPEPFLSLFCDDCIGRGLDINNGGSIYPSVHGACLMGIGTTADSLAAIEKVVFIDKQATLSDIKNALNANFEGYEELRRKLLDAPKYGNDDDFVDKYAVWFLDYLTSLFNQYRTRDGGYFYTAAAANTNNIWAGKSINATPDGRLRGAPLSDAASPTYGKDIRGVTSTFNSVTKPDYTNAATGSVINQKFSPVIFSDEKRPLLLALIKTYFKKGGQEIQINATSREMLLDAMEHPEKYENMVVRVSGFSDYYTKLNRDVQLDILNRTQHDE